MILPNSILLSHLTLMVILEEFPFNKICYSEYIVEIKLREIDFQWKIRGNGNQLFLAAYQFGANFGANDLEGWLSSLLVAFDQDQINI